jgi:hypothetical protein
MGLTDKFLRRGANAAGAAAGKGPGLLTKGMVGWGIFETASNMAAGDDFTKAAMKGTVDSILWTTYAGPMTAYQLATGIPAAGQAAYSWYNQQRQWFNMQHLNGTVGGGYQDTQKALTMRQAAVQAIQGSKLNARSALGGEARILNQNWSRSY